MTNEETIEFFLSNRDDKTAAFTLKIVPGAKNVIGLKIPFIKNFLKRNKDFIKDFCMFKQNQYYEIDLLIAFSIASVKESFEDKIKKIIPFVKKINNWAVCDSMAAYVYMIKDEREKWFEYAIKNLKAEEEYFVRFSIVLLLDYFAEEKYLDSIFNAIEKIDRKEYYIQMAIAWFISIAYIKDKKMTIDYLKIDTLDDFTHNKAISKICESLRVEKDEKLFVSKLKRKQTANYKY